MELRERLIAELSVLRDEDYCLYAKECYLTLKRLRNFALGNLPGAIVE